jgi:hypothetical protein
VPVPIARLNFWRFLPSKRSSFERCPATFRESKHVARRSLRRKRPASRGMSPRPHAVLAPYHAQNLGSAWSRFLIAFFLSVCPWLKILPCRRTKGESVKIRHYGPASETSRRDPEPQGPGRTTTSAFDDERDCGTGFLPVHSLRVPDLSRALPQR